MKDALSYSMFRPILNEYDKALLHRSARKFPLSKLQKDSRNYDELAVDFIYTSAKIEGNTYDQFETDSLLKLGITAGGKRYSDAVMLINLRDGFKKVMEIGDQDKLDIEYFSDLHKVLLKDLLPQHEQGIMRTSAVSISGSSYTPPVDSTQLRTEVKFIFEVANQYSDPFEKAIYLHCNLAYLQFFRDGNKRTARLMQTAALAQGNILPLFFHDSFINQYQAATVAYYETGNYAPYVDFFKANYQLTLSKLLGPPLPKLSNQDLEEFNHRMQRLPELQKGAGPAHTFWLLAQEAIFSMGSADQVNWADIERQTIVTSIGNNGQDPDLVAEILCKYSPGAISEERRNGIVDDIARLGPVLLKDYSERKNLKVISKNSSIKDSR